MKFSDFARAYNNIFLNVSLWKWHRGSPIWKRKKNLFPKSLHSLFLMWTTFSLRIRASLVLKYSMSPPQQTQTHSNILFRTPGKSKYFLKRMQFFPTWYYSGKRSQQQPPMPPPLSPDCSPPILRNRWPPICILFTNFTVSDQRNRARLCPLSI